MASRREKLAKKKLLTTKEKVTSEVEEPVKGDETPASLVARDEKFKLLVPANVEKKIRLACALAPNREWSGVLFFEYEGNFNDGNLKITCVDFHVQDVGTASFTRWQINESTAHYMAIHNLEDYQQGIVHSHNTMSTFFSGTDIDTLLSIGKDRHNLVSLIVNNEGTYSAAITRKIESEISMKERSTYKFFGENDDNAFEQEWTEKKVCVEYFKLEVEVKQPVIDKDDFVDNFITLSKKPVSYDYDGYTRSGYTPYGGSSYTPPSGWKKALPHDSYPQRNLSKPGASNSQYNPVTNRTTVSSYGDYGSSYNSVEYSKKNTTIVSNPTNPANKTVFSVKSAGSVPLIETKRKIDCDDYIEDLAIQLATGDITADSSTMLSLEDIVEGSMIKNFENRFGRDVGSNSAFTNWVDTTLEHMISYCDDPELKKFSRVDRQDIIVEKLMTRFKEVDQNLYVRRIIESLQYIL